ncbi:MULTISPECIES: lipoyl(octanoyl) transferase LipB [unclassified Motilimonas]|uniref:lipoyl(octanoyl) transferase LipB n=1 Tax=Motilimonas TaxID=1914248 RepID=UPI001E35229B|nr:lipoyl(octanoyl) transferase LipB [Motilimonas sp. E26]MCE0556029.1 lipoyl(octanoyl) transferase LipB [Motilimonas sp. E26]
MISNKLIVRQYPLSEYSLVWQQMKTFTDERGEQDSDEIWLVQHPSVFTQGQAGKAEHVLVPGDIPVVASDRGGQVTYHGPGQQVAYILINIKRKAFGVRDLVSHIENALIALLNRYHINAYAKPDAPGVYIDGKKIASLGLRIRKGCSFHGLALNVDMDLMPFQRINPCGYAGLEMTQLRDFTADIDFTLVQQQLIDELTQLLAYSEIEWTGPKQ